MHNPRSRRIGRFDGRREERGGGRAAGPPAADCREPRPNAELNTAIPSGRPLTARGAARMPAAAAAAAAAPALLVAIVAVAAAPALAGDALAQSMQYDPPLKQHKRVLAQAVACNDGLDLVIKSSDGSPACVGMDAKRVLLARGWAAEPPDVPRVPSIDLTEDERAWLADNPIRASYDPHWPPFEFADADGEMAGLSAAYRAEFERLIGTDFVVVPSPDWPGALGAVRAGDVDVLFMTGDTPDRREFMGFTPPHMTLATSMITLGEDVAPGDIGGKSVGTIRGYEVEAWLDENRPDVAYVPLDEGLAFTALQAGDIDVLLWFWEIADYKAQLAGVDGLHNAGGVGHTMDVSVAYALGNPILASIIEKAMGAISEVDQASMLNEATMSRPSPAMVAASALSISAPDDGGGRAVQDLPALSLTAAEQAWLASGPTIRVAYDPDWPPIEFDMDGEVAGLSAVYMQLAAAMTGAEFVPVPRAEWPDALAAVRSGEADVIFSLARTADREEYLGFTAPHTVLAWQIVTASARAIEAEDLGTIKVGTIRGYAIEEWLRDNRPDVRFTSYAGYDDLLAALRSDKIEAFVEVWPVASMEADAAGMRVFRAGELGESLPLSAGYSRSNAILGSIMEKVVDAVPDGLRDSAKAALVSPPMAPTLALTTEEETWIANNPTVQVAYDPDFAPFEYIDEAGELGGPARAYMDRFSELMGVQFELVGAETWSDSLRAMRTGDADVMFMIAVTEERKEYMGFTEPHTVLTWNMITRGDTGDVAAEDLADLRVGAVRDYAVVAWLEENMPEVRVTTFDSHAAAFTAMASDDLDVFVDTWASSLYTAEIAGIDDLYDAGPLDTTLDLAIGYSRNNNAALGSILAKALAEVPPAERERLASMLPAPGQGPARPAAAAAAAAAEPFELTGGEAAWVAANPVARVAYDPDAAPFEFTGEDGGLAGLARTYADMLSEMTGLRFEPVEAGTWTESLEAMRSGDADIMFIALDTEDRREYMSFTEPHTSPTWDMLTLGAGGRANLTAADLAGLRVGAIRDYAIVSQAAESLPGVELAEYDSHADVFDALKSGSLDVFVESWTSALIEAREYGAADDLRYAGSLDIAADMRIGFSNAADPMLGQIVERAFSAIPAEEKLRLQRQTLTPPPG